MALITCPECGSQVSTDAQTCPHCGYRIQDHLIEDARQEKRNELRYKYSRIVDGYSVDLMDCYLVNGKSLKAAAKSLSERNGIPYKTAKTALDSFYEECVYDKDDDVEEYIWYMDNPDEDEYVADDNPSRRRKKKKKKGFLIVIVLILLAVFFHKGGNSNNQFNSNFERVGYAKFELDSGINNRSYVIYTNSTDEAEMIKYARSLQTTKGGITYVHFYLNKYKAPDNTLFEPEIAYILEGYEDGRILVYQKTGTGKEYIWDSTMSYNEEVLADGTTKTDFVTYVWSEETD